jgi:4-amino-4-deoxy-L-arabinose transferase-like glycosyltransferase
MNYMFIGRIKKVFNKIKKGKDFYLILIVVLTIFLRLLNLGYSDYQGDEIKALFLPEDGQSSFEFLLDQRKGPMQFMVTFLLKYINPTYDNEFLIRLPFALAGILSVVYFYKLIKNLFDEKIAFYSAFFLATNGFFVAFSRIVQYQSFVILFDILALYLLNLSLIDKDFKIKGLYLSLIAWAISILSHYDGVFIAPFMFYLLILWFRNTKISSMSKIKHFITAAAGSLSLLLLFYIPFVLTLSQDTQEYWQGRLTGDVAAKISSSKYLFSVYQPIYVIHFYTVFFVFGILLFASSFIRNPFKTYIDKKSLTKVFRPYISGLFLYTHKKWPIIFLLLWFFVPLFFWEFIVHIPGTHIYTYLMPMFIIIGFGMLLAENIVNLFVRIEYRRVLNFSWIFVLCGFIFLQSLAVFVENRTEYPWENERFLLWTFHQPTPIFHLSMFGFPYYRNWEGIRKFTQNYPDITAYSTNERKTIARYYVPLIKSSEKAGYYVYIKNPQSFENDILNEKPFYWTNKYEPDYTFSRYGTNIVRLYIMPVGGLDDIVSQGF